MPEIKGFRLLKPFGTYKVDKMYDHFGGLVSGLVNADADQILFTDTTYFKPVYVRDKKAVRTYSREEFINGLIMFHNEQAAMPKKSTWHNEYILRWFKKNIK